MQHDCIDWMKVKYKILTFNALNIWRIRDLFVLSENYTTSSGHPSKKPRKVDINEHLVREMKLCALVEEKLNICLLTTKESHRCMLMSSKQDHAVLYLLADWTIDETNGAKSWCNIPLLFLLCTLSFMSLFIFSGPSYHGRCSDRPSTRRTQ